MASSQEVIERFVWAMCHEQTGETRPSGWQTLTPSNDRCFANLVAREVYSYGTHFPLARFCPRKRGASLWLINGDAWRGGWGTTQRHQSEARSAIARAVDKANGKLQSIIVPFSALDGAGIDRDSIRPIDVTADRWLEETRELYVSPDRIVRIREAANTPPDGYGNGFPEGIREAAHGKGEATVGNLRLSLTTTFRGHSYDGVNAAGYHTGSWKEYVPAREEWWIDGSHHATPHADGRVTYIVRSHRLGESLFRADVVDTVETWTHEASGQTIRRTQSGDVPGRANREGWTRDWQRRRRTFTFLSSFDYQERAPLYFLCALPKSSRATTVAAAIDDLASRAVHAAYARGLDVKRQGDVFGIATALDDATVYGRAKRRARRSVARGESYPRLGEDGYRRPVSQTALRRYEKLRRELYAQYRAEDMATCAMPKTDANYKGIRRRNMDTMARALFGEWAGIPDNGRRQYSSYDATRASERLATLTRGRDNGYAIGRSSRPDGASEYRWRMIANGTKQERVLVTIPGSNHGKDRRRAIESWRRASEDAARRLKLDDATRWNEGRRMARETVRLLGTDHTATEVVIARNGATYARGVMRHERRNSWETSDHRAVKLDGARWYLMVRNTVPRAG